MSFSYQPLTEQEAMKERNSFLLLDDGIYEFTVAKATAKESKSGNPMIELALTVWDNLGKEHFVYDYLVGTNNMVWKVRHFCDSIGLTKEFEDGKFNEILAQGKSGKAQIGFQKGKQKEDGTTYRDKNIVEDYISKDGTSIETPVKKESKSTTLIDDDIPF